MKKIISGIMAIATCITMLLSFTGCQNSEELIYNSTHALNITYWRWEDTSPTASGVSIYNYAYMKADGTLEWTAYTHHNGAYVTREENNADEEKEYTWEVIVHGGKPYVKVTNTVEDYVNNIYFHVEINKDFQIESLSYNMYIPGDRFYDESDSFLMTQLTVEEYKEALKEEEKAVERGLGSSGGNSGSFTNKYGTSTTKCAHSGCYLHIASSGDTNCCVQHSRRCLECNCYIDEDAMYCMDCIESALGQ